MATEKFKIFCDEDTEQSNHTSSQQQTINNNKLNNHNHLYQPSSQQPMQTRQRPGAAWRKTYSQTQITSQQTLQLPINKDSGPSKREPLAAKKLDPHVRLQLRQAPMQRQATIQQASYPHNYHNQPDAAYHSLTDEEDQENDVSMVSLGSDFEPSLIEHAHVNNALTDDEHVERDEDDEEQENNENDLSHITAATTEGEEEEDINSSRLTMSFEADESLAISDTDDDDDDESVLMKLDSAFAEHDKSVAFKIIDYVSDIEKYMLDFERDSTIRAQSDYMCLQEELDSTKRKILIDWLVEVADEFKLQTDTLFLTVNLIDRFLSKMSVCLEDFQLLGLATMFIASKYEEIYPPEMHQFIEISEDTYSSFQMRYMEQHVLKELDFRLSVPTCLFFLRKIFTFNKFPKQVYLLAEYLCYLSLLEDKPFLEYYPSEIAHAAVMLAAHELTVASNISPELKNAFDETNVNQIQRFQDDNNSTTPFCIESLLNIQLNGSNYKATHARFASTDYEWVAFIKPCVDLAKVIA